MYHVINAHIDKILEQIPSGHVSGYDFLHSNRRNVADREYQRRFKVFWRLNAALLSDAFCDHYFGVLSRILMGEKRQWDITEITRQLYEVNTHNDRQSLQFSFATKLLHSADDRSPIYDSLVAAFFFFSEPDRDKPLEERIDAFATFHRFLAAEYRRVINQDLLADSIFKFRKHFRPETFTEEKIVDSLIWGFVALQKKGAMCKGEVLYC